MKRTLASLLLVSTSMAWASGASDDSLEALAREALPGWAPGQFHAITVTDSDSRPVRIAVTPRLVLQLDDRHRSLVVSGVPNNGTKTESAGHAAAGNLGLYGFTRRGERWVRTSAQDSVAWTGFSGEVGALRAVKLGPGQAGLAVENGSCWQGVCGEWLGLYAVTPQGARSVLQLMIRSDSTIATEECRDWLAGRLRALPERYDAEFCYRVAGRWHLATPTGRKTADVVVRFSGREAAVDARTGKPAVRLVDEALVLRRRGSGYEVLSGRNPTHDI